MNDASVKLLFWFLVIALIGNRLILRFYYKRKFYESRKPEYEERQNYYLGFLHATLLALVAVSMVSEYPAWLY